MSRSPAAVPKVTGLVAVSDRDHRSRIDITAMARSHGCWAAGPVTEADNLGPALRSAAKEAADGAVAVVHVRTGHS